MLPNLAWAMIFPINTQVMQSNKIQSTSHKTNAKHKVVHIFTLQMQGLSMCIAAVMTSLSPAVSGYMTEDTTFAAQRH